MDEELNVEEDSETKEYSNDSKQIPIFTVDELLDKIGFGIFQLYLALYCGSYFMMEACEITMLSLLLPFLKKKMDLSSIQEGIIGGVVFTGISLGSYFFGWIADKFGRRFAISISVVISCFFGLLSSFCWEYYIFMIFRFFVGFGTGGIPIPYSLFVEYLPPKNRGIYILLLQIFWCLGTIYEALIGWIILTNDSFFKGYSWNWYVLMTSLPLILNILLLPFTPESIRFLSMGEGPKNEQKIKKILKAISKVNFSTKNLPEGSRYRIKMKSENQKRRGKFSDLCKKETLFLFVCICVFFMSGSFIYYGVALSSPDFFESQNLQNPSYSPFLGTLILTCSEIIGFILPAIFFCFLGRKVTQGIFFAVTGISLFMLVIPNDRFAYKLIFGLLARMSIMAAFCVSWVISTESLPTNVRTFGNGIANGLSKICTIIAPFVSYVFPYENHMIPKIVFGLVSFLAAIVSFLYPYETTGKNLADIKEEMIMKFFRKKKKDDLLLDEEAIERGI